MARRSLKEIADAMRADLATPSGPSAPPEQFDDISKVTEAVEELTQEIRKRQESGHQIIVNAAPAAPPVTVDKHDSTPAELKLAWKHRGLALKVLQWVLPVGLGMGVERLLKVLGLIH